MKADADKLFEEARERTRERILRDRDGASAEVKPVLDEIHRRLFDADFNIEALERARPMTPRVRRLFRTDLATTPKKYLTDCKMETGRWLLEHTDLKVWQIAGDLGYSRTGNFSRDFKAWARRTPASVQETARPDAAVMALYTKTPVLSPLCVNHSPPAQSHGELDRLPRKPKRRTYAWRTEDGVDVDVDAEERLLAEVVWRVLADLPVAAQMDLVRNWLGFGSPALFELLSENSRELGRKDRQRGVELAEVALASLDGCAAALGDRVIELRALGWARLSNALRLACDLKEADRVITRAETEWATPRRERDCRIEAEILALKGTLRFFQRRLSESKDLLDEVIALCRAFELENLLVQSLLQRVDVVRYAGEPEATLNDLNEVVRLLEGKTEPFLELNALQELAIVWCQVGDHSKAEESLTAAKALCRSLDLPVIRHQLEWIDGLVHQGRGELDAAAKSFQTAHAGFLHVGDLDDAAVVALDRAKLCLATGRNLEALSLASEAIPILQDLELHPEAITCADLLRKAIAARRISRLLLEKARRCLWVIRQKHCSLVQDRKEAG